MTSTNELDGASSVESVLDFTAALAEAESAGREELKKQLKRRRERSPRKPKAPASALAKDLHKLLRVCCPVAMPDRKRAKRLAMCDIGIRHENRLVYATTNAVWQAYLHYRIKLAPRPLTPQALDCHFERGQDLALTVATGGPWSMFMLRATDVESMRAVLAAFFGGGYVEEFEREVRAWVIFENEGASPHRVNQFLLALDRHLRDTATTNRTPPVRVVGSCTVFKSNGDITRRGELFPAPKLPNGQASLEALASQPLSSLTSLLAIVGNGSISEEPSGFLDNIYPPSGKKAGFDVSTFGGKHCVMRDLRVSMYRLPTLVELEAEFRRRMDGTVDDEQVRQIQEVHAFWADHYDPAKAAFRLDYAKVRDDRIALVESRLAAFGADVFDALEIPDEYRRKVTAEKIAVLTCGVELNSFLPQRDPLEQLTFGTDAGLQWFRALRANGAYPGTIPGESEYIHVRRLAYLLDLIDPFDEEWYSPEQSKYKEARGICKKWTVGVAHPRRAEFDDYLPTLKTKLLRNEWWRLSPKRKAEYAKAA